jgi:hypothetical protein
MENGRFLFDEMDDDPVRSQQITDFLDQYEDEADKAWETSKRFPLARGVKPEEYENREDWLELIERYEREASDASSAQRQVVEAQRAGQFNGLDSVNYLTAPQLDRVGLARTAATQTPDHQERNEVLDDSIPHPEEPMLLFEALDNHEDEDDDLIFLSHSAGPASQHFGQSTQDSGFVPSQPLPVPSRKRTHIASTEVEMEAPAQKVSRTDNSSPSNADGVSYMWEAEDNRVQQGSDGGISGQSVMTSWDTGEDPFAAYGW